MTHWYGWLLFGFVVASAALDARAVVINAWRGLVAGCAIFWTAVWVTVAFALVLA